MSERGLVASNKYSVWTPRNLVWIGLTVVSLSILIGAIRVSAAVRDIQARINDVQSAGQGGGGFSPARLGDDIAAVKADMAVLRNDVGWLLPLAPLFGWLPQYGGDVAAAPALFDIADSLVSTGDALYQGWAGALAGRTADSGQTITENVAAQIGQGGPHFDLANAYLRQAVAQRQTIQTERLSARVTGLVQRLDQALPIFQLAIDGSRALPTLLGEDAPRSYLIVAQNEDELRATGGFASSVGLLNIDHGKIGDLAFIDSYQVDDLKGTFPEPPAPLENYMLAGYWLFRDANWSPDFPSSARELASLYELGQHKKVDGVIAVDQEMVRLVVQALQPVEVGGPTPATVTGDNLLSYMRDSWAPPPGATVNAAWLARKGFIGRLAGALQARVQGGGSLNPGGLARGMLDALNGKHLMVYLPGTSVAPALAKLGWDGALHATTGDYAFVVDSNIGFNKANALVSAQYNYEVIVSADLTANAQMTINYRHSGGADPAPCVQKAPAFNLNTNYAELMNMCYWDYLRFYVPRGAALQESTKVPIPAAQMLNKQPSDGQPEILANDNGKDAFATLFYLKRGDRQDVYFKYQLPLEVLQPVAANRWRYTLIWQKQAGTPAFTAQFHLNLPAGFSVASVAPVDSLRPEAAAAGSRLGSSFRLDADKSFTVVIQLN